MKFRKPFEENLGIDRPKLYESLKSSGKLLEYLSDVEAKARSLYADLILKEGLDSIQAESEAIQSLLLPSEKDLPSLGELPKENLPPQP